MKRVYYPKSIKDICNAVSALKGVPFVVRSRTYSRLQKDAIDPASVIRVIDLSKFDQVLRFDGIKGEITVQAGCTLAQVNKYLSERSYVLPSSPQFTGVSAGVCAATPIHGYSRQHQCIATLISRLKILMVDTGDVFDVTSADKDWGNVFFGRAARVIYLEVTFDCIPDTVKFLSLGLESDDHLKAMLSNGGEDQQIITWYPAARKVSEISLRSQPMRNVTYRRVTTPFSSYRYPSYQWFLLKRALTRSQYLMGPANLLVPGFSDLNIIESLYLKSVKAVDVEIAVPLQEVWRLIDIINALSAAEKKINVVFSWGGVSAHISKKTWDPAADIWVELVGDETRIRHIISRLKTGSYSFNTAKHVPEMD